MKTHWFPLIRPYYINPYCISWDAYVTRGGWLTSHESNFTNTFSNGLRPQSCCKREYFIESVKTEIARLPLICLTHRIHVWYIYLHLVDFYGKCSQIYHTWILWVSHLGKYLLLVPSIGHANPSSLEVAAWATLHVITRHPTSPSHTWCLEV